MSKRSVKLLIEDILTSAQKIISYTKDLSFEHFTNDSKTLDAAIRNFEPRFFSRKFSANLP